MTLKGQVALVTGASEHWCCDSAASCEARSHRRWDSNDGKQAGNISTSLAEGGFLRLQGCSRCARGITAGGLLP